MIQRTKLSLDFVLNNQENECPQGMSASNITETFFKVLELSRNEELFYASAASRPSEMRLSAFVPYTAPTSLSSPGSLSDSHSYSSNSNNSNNSNSHSEEYDNGYLSSNSAMEEMDEGEAEMEDEVVRMEDEGEDGDGNGLGEEEEDESAEGESDEADFHPATEPRGFVSTRRRSNSYPSPSQPSNSSRRRSSFKANSYRTGSDETEEFDWTESVMKFSVRQMSTWLNITNDDIQAWRFRDYKRALFHGMTKDHQNFIASQPAHQVLNNKRLPNKLTPLDFARRLLLVVFHYIVKSGRPPRFWERMDKSKIMRIAQMQKITPSVGLMAHKLYMNTGNIADAILTAQQQFKPEKRL